MRWLPDWKPRINWAEPLQPLVQDFEQRLPRIRLHIDLLAIDTEYRHKFLPLSRAWERPARTFRAAGLGVDDLRQRYTCPVARSCRRRITDVPMTSQLPVVVNDARSDHYSVQ